METIKGTIVKKGRKYFQVKLDTTRNDYLHKVLINEVSKSLKPGDSFELDVQENWANSYRTGKRYIESYTPVSPEEGKQAEIERWTEYCRDALHKGYTYRKGMAKLEEIGAKKELQELAELKEELDYQDALQRFSNWCRKDVFADELWDRIHKKGRKKDIERIEKEYWEMQERMAERSKGKTQEETEEKPEETPVKSRTFPDHFVYDHGLCTGAFFQENGHLYRILDLSPRLSAWEEYGEDAMSFGILSDYFYIAKVKDVTEAKDEQTEAYRSHLRDIKDYEKKKEALENAEADIKKVCEKGRRIPEGTEWDSIRPVASRDVLKDTSNVYGHGEMLFESRGELWYITCNTADGDDWRVNSVSGIGYGYEVPIDEEIRKLMDVYRAARKKSNDARDKMEEYRFPD